MPLEPDMKSRVYMTLLLDNSCVLISTLKISYVLLFVD